ncbi:MAG: hypothetical protein K0R67_2189 [Paenibacillus sp.]|nr:hypothetical protein [Paenibacillus sp.]
MARTVTHVPYGYEPEKETIRGTLIVYDAFDESFSLDDLQLVSDWAEEHNLARIVLYPLHEQTIRRMLPKAQADAAEPYHIRLKLLEEHCELLKHSISLEIDEWERKRKKYTPMDTALQFLTDKYKGPHFLGISGHYANLFSTYSSFEPWIRKLRLVILPDGAFHPHPKLAAFDNRWDTL